MGGIPKKLFNKDIRAVKNIMTVIKQGGIINISPEGINTIYGASYPVIPATANLIKKLKVPVVSVGINGAFLTLPKWNYDADYTGRVDVHVDLLFSPEDIENKTTDEMVADMNKALAYNDYVWARENNVEYKAEERTKGLNHLLYWCPNCKSRYTLETGDNKIWCTECGNGAFVDNRFQLNKIKDDDAFPLDISKWFEAQDALMAQDTADENFEIRENCSVKTFNKSGYKLYTKYAGEIVINKDGVRFSGKDIKTGEEKEVFTERSLLPMVSNTLNKSFDYYHGEDYYEFVLDNGIRAVECSRAIHHIYNNYEA